MYIILLVICSSALEVFFQECIQERMIFAFYGKWLNWLMLKHGICVKLAYVLGYCPFCHGFWLFTFFWFAFGNSLDLLFFLFAGLNYMFTLTFLKIRNYE